MNPSHVSVVIPTYNGGMFVPQAIESVFAQTCLPREIIVVDDCSADDTVAVVGRMAAESLIPLKVIELEHNSGGPAHPINVGIGRASSPFISVLDQDDVYVNDALESHLAVLGSNEQPVFSFALTGDTSNQDIVLQREKFVRCLVDSKVSQDTSERIIIDGSVMQQLLARYGNFVVGFPGFVFRKEDAEAVGLVNETWRIGADLDFLYALANRGHVGFVRKIGYLRRQHDTNVCNDRTRMLAEETQIALSALRRYAGLGADVSVVDCVKRRLLASGYRLREEGEYRWALKCYLQAISQCGCDARSVVDVLKLGPHWLSVKCRNGIGAWSALSSRG